MLVKQLKEQGMTTELGTILILLVLGGISVFLEITFFK